MKQIHIAVAALGNVELQAVGANEPVTDYCGNLGDHRGANGIGMLVPIREA